MTGREIGGQLSLTLDVENYPGYPGIGRRGTHRDDAETGGELWNRRCAWTTLRRSISALIRFAWRRNRGRKSKRSRLSLRQDRPPVSWGVPGEEMVGRGVSYCATCDGFFFRDKRVVVVGGGDAALEEGMFLTRFASEVHVVHRRDQLRANVTLQDRAFQNETMRFIWDSVVEEILGGDEGVYGVRLKNVKTGEASEFETDGVFIFIGHEPNTHLYEGQIDLDDKGYIVTDKLQQTSVKGVFAGGDVQDYIYRQAVTAAGTGAGAAIEAERFLAELENRVYPGLTRD